MVVRRHFLCHFDVDIDLNESNQMGYQALIDAYIGRMVTDPWLVHALLWPIMSEGVLTSVRNRSREEKRSGPVSIESTRGDGNGLALPGASR